jgi:hypothetical protein
MKCNAHRSEMTMVLLVMLVAYRLAMQQMMVQHVSSVPGMAPLNANSDEDIVTRDYISLLCTWDLKR